MTGDGWATVVATVIAPLAAFWLSIWYQERKQKQESKMRVFTAALMHRRGSPPRVEWVNALNTIEVVFQDAPKVLEAWRSLYDHFHVPNLDQRLLDQKSNDLMMAMALDLGYANLLSTNLDRFYFPQSHSNLNGIQLETQLEWLRVLKATKTLHIEPLSDAQQSMAVPPPSPPTA